MKLSEWLALPRPDGQRKRRRDFASAIGVHPTMITEYAEGRAWPGRDKLEAIVEATDGAVGADDFLSEKARRLRDAARARVGMEAAK